MLPTKIDFLNSNYFIVFIHVLFWVFAAYTLSQFNIMQFPNADNIIQWDAGWYQGIVKDGYWFSENAQSNVAFFPLFPLTWKVLQVAPLYMALINLSLFITGFIILSNAFSFNLKECLLALSLPSLFFCYVPFSEAFFFFSVSIFLFGFQKNSYWLIALGLLLAGLCRATSMLFLPAFFLIEFSALLNKNNRINAFFKLLSYIIISAITILAVAYIQHSYAGRWFDFLFVQKFWNKAWQLPKLPLTTWDGSRLLWVDGTALLICFSAILIVLKHIVDIIRNVTTSHSKSFLFSVAYLSVIGLVTLFYSNTTQQTSIYSLNRYVFATPFLIVFIIELSRKNYLNKSNLYVFIVLLLCFSLLFGVASFHAITLGGIALFILYSSLYFTMIAKAENNYVVVFFYLFNMILQMKLLDWYLNGKWVG